MLRPNRSIMHRSSGKIDHRNFIRILLFLFISVMTTQVLAEDGGGVAARSTGSGQVMLITDGSGSMWGQVRKRSKVYLARDAIKKILPQYHNRVSMGLMAFGSRKKRSCNDVTQIVPVAPLDSARFIKEFNGVNPLGRTPVTLAIKKAAQALDYKKRKATIIVLIDGFENCSGDPCALARQLKRDGKDITVHMVGLGMSARDQRSNQCIVNATGGELVAVNSGSALRRSLVSLINKSASPAKSEVLALPQKKPAIIAKPKGPPELLLTALMSPKGPQISAGLEWRVRTFGSDEAQKDLYIGEEPQPRLKLKPGKYTIIARLDSIKITEDVTVGDGGLTRANINFDAGTVRIKAYADRDGKPLSTVFYTIYKKSGNGKEPDSVVAITSTPDPEYNLPSGNYNIVVQHGGTKSDRIVNVVPGKTSNVDIVMYSGELVLNAIQASTGKPIAGAYYYIYEDDPEAKTGRREVARSAANKPDFRLPAGLYHIRVKWGFSEMEMRGAVRAGKRQTLQIPMRSGMLNLDARIRGQASSTDYPITYSVFSKPLNNAPTRLIAKTSRKSPEFQLDAGRYQIVAHYGSANADTRRELNIGSGQTKSLTLDIPAAIMDLKFRAKGEKRFSRDVFWSIRSPGGDTVWTTGKSAPRTPISPGKYIIAATHRGKLYEKSLSFRAGEVKNVVISPN